MTRQAPLALAFPLRGSQLIEASAGTGKTFTISALYLRLVLGHGGELAGFGRELLPPQILVVTFTDAATKELRERIRTRLAEAARFFREETTAPDALIAELRDQFAAEQWPGCASRLDIAAQWMDEAAVSTIHSWCQRMLREHAFDSGSLFTQTLETDHGDLLGEVLRDYWRLFCYPMQGDALNWVRANWGGPAALLPRVRALFGSEREVDQEQTPAQLIEACLLERRAALVQLKAPWLQWAAQLREICLQGVASKAVDGRKMQARYFEPWFEKITAWAEDEAIEQLDIGTGFSRLTPKAWPRPGRAMRRIIPHWRPWSGSRPRSMPCRAPTPRCCNTPRAGSVRVSKRKNAGGPRWASTTCCCASTPRCRPRVASGWRR